MSSKPNSSPPQVPPEEAPKTKDWIKTMVLLILDDIRELNETQRESVPVRQQIAMKYQTFFEKFPSLCMKLVDDGDSFEMDRFDEMLELMERVHTSDLDLQETNTQVGQQYFNQYVKPHIDVNKEINGDSNGDKKK